MADFITDAEWADYESEINDFHSVAFQQTIILQSAVRVLNSDGNDHDPLYENLELKCLIQYNHFRSWPINKDNIMGEIDNESMLVFFNSEYLRGLNLTNEHGLLKFKPSSDKFIIDGIRYKAKGDSKTAQTKDKTLLHFIVLKRDYLDTPDDKYIGTSH